MTGVWENITPPGCVSALGIALSAAMPSTLYVNAYSSFPPSGPATTAGIFKSTNGGNTWTNIGTNWFDFDGVTPITPNPWTQGVAWTLAVDPTDANVVYAMCAFNGPQGIYKSTDGGTTWKIIMSSSDTAAMSADIYAIAINAADHNHLLVTFHSGWAGGGDAGVAESLNGGATWIRHPPTSGWGAGHYAFFLGQDDVGGASSTHWILATQADGFWRTTNSGSSWTKVSSSFNMQHGAGALYRARNGKLYMGATSHLIRSSDNGQSWADCGAPSNPDGYNAIIGDGSYMYTRSANTGTESTGPLPFVRSLETDGASWNVEDPQTFLDGPGWMACNRSSQIIYAALWDHGLWRLRTSTVLPNLALGLGTTQ